MKRTLIAMVALWSSAAAAEHNDWSALTTKLTHAQSQANVPAMGLVIMDDNQPAIVAAWGRGIHASTPFRWGSISKTFTALSLLRLVEQGKVALTDPVRQYLPEGTFENPWAISHPLRLLHLLELSGGFGDLSGVEFNLNEPLSLDAALALNPNSRIVRWPPGLQHSYSNINPGLTAAVIEQVTGAPFETFAHTEVLAAMGMPAASFEPVAGLPGGFKADGTTEIPYWHMTFRAFGGLNASVEEMSHFLTVLMNNGQFGTHAVFDPATLTGLYRATSGLAGVGKLNVSYGTGAYGRVSHGHVFYGHGGDADGYRSRYGLLPQAGRGYLIVINTDNPPLLRQLQKTIEGALTADLPAPSVEPAVSVPLATLTAYAGEYYPASARFGIERWQSGQAPRAHVSVSNHALVFTRNRRRVPLVALGSGKFRRPEDPVATVIFRNDQAGTLYLQGELGNFVNLNSTPCPGFIAACNSQ
jgi:CubicO group peptidase (beta-lactamase class C family)